MIGVDRPLKALTCKNTKKKIIVLIHVDVILSKNISFAIIFLLGLHHVGIISKSSNKNYMVGVDRPVHVHINA